MFGIGKRNGDAGEQETPQAPETQAPQGRSAPGGQRLNLVGREQFARAVVAAVRHGVQTHFEGAETERVDAVVATVKSGMVHLLRKESKAVRGLPKAAFLKEVQESKAKIEAESEAARRELESLLGGLSERRNEVGQMQANLVAESRLSGMEQDCELSARINSMFDGAEDSPEMDAIREQVTALMLTQMQTDRDKVIEAQMSEHLREVQKFERRISKLTNSLELTEDELKRIAAAKGIDIGVASLFREVQGLSAGENDYETKKELMSCIFEANLALQKGEEVTSS